MTALESKKTRPAAMRHSSHPQDPMAALPDWLLPENDAIATKLGVLRPDPFPDRPGGNNTAGTQPPPRNYAAVDVVNTAITASRREERHAAVRAALSGGRAKVGEEEEAGIPTSYLPRPAPLELRSMGATAGAAPPSGEDVNWSAPIPAVDFDAPSYPLWLAPELDSVPGLNPAAFPLAPLPPPAPRLHPGLAADLSSARAEPEKVFHMQRAEPGDSLVVMSRNERPSWASSPPGAPAQATRAQWGGAPAQYDDYYGGQEEAAPAARAVGGHVPKPMPSAPLRGLTIADTIYARVATYEKDARRKWN